MGIALAKLEPRIGGSTYCDGRDLGTGIASSIFRTNWLCSFGMPAMLNEQLTNHSVCEMMLHQLGMKGPTQMPYTIELSAEEFELVHEAVLRLATFCHEQIKTSAKPAVWEAYKEQSMVMWTKLYNLKC